MTFMKAISSSLPWEHRNVAIGVHSAVRRVQDCQMSLIVLLVSPYARTERWRWQTGTHHITCKLGFFDFIDFFMHVLGLR